MSTRAVSEDSHRPRPDIKIGYQDRISRSDIKMPFTDQHAFALRGRNDQFTASALKRRCLARGHAEELELRCHEALDLAQGVANPSRCGMQLPCRLLVADPHCPWSTPLRQTLGNEGPGRYTQLGRQGPGSCRVPSLQGTNSSTKEKKKNKLKRVVQIVETLNPST